MWEERRVVNFQENRLECKTFLNGTGRRIDTQEINGASLKTIGNVDMGNCRRDDWINNFQIK